MCDDCEEECDDLLSKVLATLDFPDNQPSLPEPLKKLVGEWKQEYEKITGKRLWEAAHEYFGDSCGGAKQDVPVLRPRTRKVSKKAVR